MNAEHSLNNARPAATAQVISLGDLHPDPHRHVAAAPLVHDANPLHSVRANLRVCAGEVELSVRDLLAVQEGQVLVLDRTVDEPVDLLLEGKVVARGQLVAVDGRFALRIVELPVALKP
jgi:flagellar motor switch protein FliN/FliY